MAHQVPNEIIGIIDRMYGGSPYAYLEMVGGALLLLGVLVLGASMLRAGVLPCWTALLLLATDLAALFAFVPATLADRGTVSRRALPFIRGHRIFDHDKGGRGAGKYCNGRRCSRPYAIVLPALGSGRLRTRPHGDNE